MRGNPFSQSNNTWSSYDWSHTWACYGLAWCIIRKSLLYRGLVLTIVTRVWPLFNMYTAPSSSMRSLYWSSILFVDSFPMRLGLCAQPGAHKRVPCLIIIEQLLKAKIMDLSCTIIHQSGIYWAAHFSSKCINWECSIKYVNTVKQKIISATSDDSI